MTAFSHDVGHPAVQARTTFYEGSGSDVDLEGWRRRRGGEGNGGYVCGGGASGESSSAEFWEGLVKIPLQDCVRVKTARAARAGCLACIEYQICGS